MCKTKKFKEKKENGDANGCGGSSNQKDITSLKSWKDTNLALHREYLESGDVEGYQSWCKDVINLLKVTDAYTLAAIHSIIKQTMEVLESEIESSKTLNSQLILFVLGAASGSVGGLVSVAANDNISFNFLYLLGATIIGILSIIGYCHWLRGDVNKTKKEYLFYKELITIIEEVEKQK